MRILHWYSCVSLVHLGGPETTDCLPNRNSRSGERDILERGIGLGGGHQVPTWKVTTSVSTRRLSPTATGGPWQHRTPDRRGGDVRTGQPSPAAPRSIRPTAGRPGDSARTHNRHGRCRHHLVPGSRPLDCLVKNSQISSIAREQRKVTSTECLPSPSPRPSPHSYVLTESRVARGERGQREAVCRLS